MKLLKYGLVAAVAVLATACFAPSANQTQTVTETVTVIETAVVVNTIEQVVYETITRTVPYRIVFSSNIDGDSEIYAMNSDGTNFMQLTDNDDEDFSPAVSPDGQLIAFVTDRHVSNDIYTMNADGNNQRLRTLNTSDDIFPSWSEDGSRIIFVSDRDRAYETYSMNIDGTDVMQLTDNNSIRYTHNAADVSYAGALDLGISLWTDLNPDLLLEESDERRTDLRIMFVDLPADSEFTGLYCLGTCSEESYDGITAPSTFYPGVHNVAEILVDTSSIDAVGDACINYVANIVAHEIGHHLGLKHHPDEDHLLWGAPSPLHLPDIFTGKYDIEDYDFSDEGYVVPDELPEADGCLDVQ